MAIISIPTSIGGLNIPGGLFSGPLSDLTDFGGTFSYHYPRDLGSSTRAHSVDFAIQEIQEYTMEELEALTKTGIKALGDEAVAFGQSAADAWNSEDGLLGVIGNTLDSAWSVTKETVSGGFPAVLDKGIGGLFSGVKSAVGAAEDFGNVLNLKDKQKITNVGFISLYMPENFNLASALSYDDNTSIASAMGALPLVGKAFNTATNFVSGSNDAIKLVLNRGGYVFNPQKQVLFQGVTFREFSLSFTFTPYSAAEAEQVKNIIQKFRMYSSPKRNEQLGKNMFWVPPALFDISFKQNGRENPNLPKLQRCVIESIDVNYTPNGWSTYGDGAPVQTTMTMQFKEIALISRDDIKEGY
jgi:hypothetical protein